MFDLKEDLVAVVSAGVLSKGSGARDSVCGFKVGDLGIVTGVDECACAIAKARRFCFMNKVDQSFLTGLTLVP